MSEHDNDNKIIKDNNDFEFIKELVIDKKHKKLKRRLLQLCMTAICAVIFGLIAAATMVIVEPSLYKKLHKEEEDRSQFTFPTKTPQEQEVKDPEPTKAITPTVKPVVDDSEEDPEEPDPIITSIDATVDDFLSIYKGIQEIAYEANKSQVLISSSFTVFDIFGNEVEKIINTSGVVIAANNSDFLILTSLDSVKEATSVKIKFSDTTYVSAELIDYESDLNLAVMALAIKDIPKIYLNSLQVAELGDSHIISVGQPVIALGNPNGHFGSMETGMITSKGSWASVTDNRIELFNTDMDSNTYSDGVIVDMKGQVIGIITRTLKEDVNEELCTAIGISEITSIIEKMGNQKPRIYFGIKADDMTLLTKQEYEIENGIFVSEVQTESPAFEAGLKNGDIILSVNDIAITNTRGFYNKISEYKSGEKITIKIKRTAASVGSDKELTVTLGDKVQ